MPKEIKLYQILEKAQIETKIAVEIQDWILDTMEEKQEGIMFRVEETKLNPLYSELLREIQAVQTSVENLRLDLEREVASVRADMGREFASLQDDREREFVSVRSEIATQRAEMDLKFRLMNEKFDARFNSLEKLIYLLAVPIVTSSIGALGIIFMKIYESLK